MIVNFFKYGIIMNIDFFCAHFELLDFLKYVL